MDLLDVERVGPMHQLIDVESSAEISFGISNFWKRSVIFPTQVGILSGYAQTITASHSPAFCASILLPILSAKSDFKSSLNPPSA